MPNVLMYCQLLLLALPHPPYSVLADQFTNPSNDKNDLSQTFTIGENVTITWTTALTNINLRVTHWDMEDEIVIGVLLTEQPNTGEYQWTIGEGDNIDQAEIERSSKFALRLSSGISGLTSYPVGFVDGRLSSRGFFIKANSSSSSSSSSSSASSSTPASRTTTSFSSIASPTFDTITATRTSATATDLRSASPTAPVASSSELSVGAKAGIAVGAAAAGIVAVALVTVLLLRRRRRSAAAVQASHAARAPGVIEIGTDTHIVELNGRSEAYEMGVETRR